MRIEFNQVQTLEDFKSAYLEFIDYLYDTTFYVGNDKETEELYSVNNFNYLVSNVRLTQRRMKLVENDSSISKNFIKEKWAGNGIKYSDGQKGHEFTGVYGPPNFTYDIDKSYYKKGGYVLDVNVLEVDETTTINTINSYFDNGWLDDRTASLIMDFVIYNPYLEILMYSRLTVEIEPSGRLKIDTMTDSMRRSYYGDGLGVFRAF